MAEFVRLEPALVHKIWGGKRLGESNAAGEGVGEAWILSAREDNPSIVASGPHAGESFLDYVNDLGPVGLGKNAGVMDAFPTLIKFIDAATPLSIQVHPDDAYARANGMPYGKTEMWIILAAEPGAFLYLGVKEEMTPEEFATAIADGSIEDKLNRVPVKQGDVYFIQAGTLHAIGGGILLAEVQQNSDTTYRVWDFGRVGADGKPRELHIPQACDVANLEPLAGLGELEEARAVLGGTCQMIGQGTCFRTERWVLTGEAELPVTSDSFMAVIMLEGMADLALNNQAPADDQAPSGAQTAAGEHPALRQAASAKAGETYFVPAQDAELRVTPSADGCTLLCVTVPAAV
ncbi:MAG: type I phosphomannose isomerase catalytic subunit [Olegusella sp.]|nr:type I phosphomannose isomerase catalytic subunit [Olegusella sp.]